MDTVNSSQVPKLPSGPIPFAPQRRILLAALAIAALLCMGIAAEAATKQVLLFLTGMAIGLVLYQTLFGFTSAFRVLIAERRSAGLRAQMIMLGAACLLFFPVLASGTLWGQPVIAFISPVGVSVACGAFLFGIGMQLGGGCASGTLYTLGGGSTRMAVTLLFFIMGSVLGVTQLAWWEGLPSLGPVSLITGMGWPWALALNLAVFLVAYVLVAGLERARHGNVVRVSQSPDTGADAHADSIPPAPRSWLRGPWPLLAGALALAALNFLTLALAGRPWGITSAYGLWGGKWLQALGVPVVGWSGYNSPEMQATLQKSVLADITSVMDFGIILGALLAASAAGKFKPLWRISGSQFAASLVGGLLLGYGARISYGCNIGAYFSGIASGSLHGWLWIVFALLGTWAGLKLRPWFGLSDAAPSLRAPVKAPNTTASPRPLSGAVSMFFSLSVLTALPAPSLAIEEPDYQVVQSLSDGSFAKANKLSIDKRDDIEIRQYAAYTVAEVLVQGPASKAGNQAFPILAGYIFGKNKGERRFAMTAPVTQVAAPVKMAMTAPVTQLATPQGVIVQFALPKGVSLSNAPEPLDARVQLREVPARRLAVIRYSGLWSKANYAKHLAKLEAALHRANIAWSGEPEYARYNAPFTPWFMRRNEIWLVL
jgi:uncharacterized membrane protein YedE/YeeE